MNDTELQELLSSFQEYVGKLIDGIEKCIEYFRSQQEHLALPLFADIIEGLQWTIEVAFGTKEVLKQYEIEIDETQINQVFKELLEAVQNQDYVLTADILEYEVLEWLSLCRQQLTQISH